VGRANRYLNTLGSWSSYRDLGSWDDIPERVAHITEGFLGLKGLLSGHPRLAGFLGVMLAVHVAEQVTGGLGTMGMRLWGRGEPFGKYRGVILRRQPPGRLARLFDWLSGGRVTQADGFYFFESGRTWQCWHLETQVGDTPRALTALKSLSLPAREFYFDRPIEPQQAVDIAMGNLEPDTAPGFLGSVNELENATVSLGNLKRLFFAANWLLVDPSERDGGGSAEGVDYDAVAGGRTPGQNGNPYRFSPRWPGSGSGPAVSVNRSRPPEPPPPWPSATSATRPAKPIPIKSKPAGQPLNIKPPATGPAPVQYGAGAPAEVRRAADPNDPTIFMRIEGQERPVIVKRVVISPLTKTRKADAQYYDDRKGEWRQIVEDPVRQLLARAVDDGLVRTTE